MPWRAAKIFEIAPLLHLITIKSSLAEQITLMEPALGCSRLSILAVMVSFSGVEAADYQHHIHYITTHETKFFRRVMLA